MTRLAVTADLHCDDFGSRLDPSTGLNARWVDAIDMTRWVANDAQERGADALIVAGDFSEQRHPAPWRVDMIRDAIAAFRGPKLLLRGNHDGQRAGRSIVDVLAEGRPGWHGFSRPDTDGVKDTAIAGIPYLDTTWLRTQPGLEHVAEADALQVLADQFLVVAGGLFAQVADLAPRRVLVVHQGLAGGLMSDTQAAFLGDRSLVVDTRALAAQGWDAILAGHFHKHQVISTDPLVAYAGAPTRTDFGEEHQEKGYLIVDVDEAGARLEFVPTPARRFVTITDPGDDYELAAAHLDGAIVRVLDLDPAIDPGAVRRELEELDAFEVQEIRPRPRPTAPVAGLSESLSAEQALVAYFADDPEREPLVELGRRLLEEAA